MKLKIAIILLLLTGTLLFCEGSFDDYDSDYHHRELKYVKIASDETEYDNKGNKIYCEDYITGREDWWEYDSKGNMIHHKYEEHDKDEMRKYAEEYIDEYDIDDPHEIMSLAMLTSNDAGDEWYIYDEKGKLIHYIDGHGFPKTYEYDSKGNLIREKEEASYGSEIWYEYDSKGNKIHSKDNTKENEYGENVECWWEYDIKGNMIHFKSNERYKGEYEEWYKYDSKGNMIYFKDDTNEKWYEYEYDSKGNMIYKKIKWNGYFGEVCDEFCYEYDSKGNMTHCKQLNDDSNEEWWEYTFWGNGNIESCVHYINYSYYE